MHRPKILLVIVAAASIGSGVWTFNRTKQSHGTELPLTSDAYRLDKIYRSMEGPMSIQSNIFLGASEKTPLQWITGIETQVVDATDGKRISQEYFCHSNLTFGEKGVSPGEYNRRFGGRTHLDWRLFTLVPGRLSIDFPEGFGVPVLSKEPLDYVTMSLNLNAANQAVNVRMQTKVHTIGADQPDAPTQALFRRALYVLQPNGVTASTNQACAAHMGTQHRGSGCAEVAKLNLDGTAAAPNEGLMNHWIVPPGRHLYRTEITPQLNLPFDTNIHYATIHVHPFARGMKLRDLTTGVTVLDLSSRDWPDRVGVASVDEFKSVKGITISRTHRYELLVEYDNTLSADTDAMAILYLYLLEKDLA